MSDFIWHDYGTQLAWIKSGEVFSVATKRKVALVRGRELFSLHGEPLNLHLQGVGLVSQDGTPTPSAFMTLLAN